MAYHVTRHHLKICYQGHTDICNADRHVQNGLNSQVTLLKMGRSFCLFSLATNMPEGQYIFSCAATQYILLCVCLCVCLSVCPQFLILNVSLFEYLEYSRIFKERERDFISKSENTQQTYKQTNTKI